MKPANYYLSAVHMPDYIESAIAKLSRHDRLNLLDDLVESMRDRGWTPSPRIKTILANCLDWLEAQSTSTFKDIHRWITNELI